MHWIFTSTGRKKKQSIVLFDRESYMERESKPTTFPIWFRKCLFLSWATVSLATCVFHHLRGVFGWWRLESENVKPKVH